MRNRERFTRKMLMLGIGTSIVAVACQDVSVPVVGPDAELRANASFRGQQMREGSVIPGKNEIHA
jgi:hypothetical protein